MYVFILELVATNSSSHKFQMQIELKYTQSSFYAHLKQNKNLNVLELKHQNLKFKGLKVLKLKGDFLKVQYQAPFVQIKGS
jgi:hypothetical protein